MGVDCRLSTILSLKSSPMTNTIHLDIVTVKRLYWLVFVRMEKQYNWP
jgi:hypothetical protein